MDSSTGLPPQFASTYNPPQPMTGPSQWSTGLRDCGKDCSSCCLTCWCTFISFGQIAEIVDKGTTYSLRCTRGYLFDARSNNRMSMCIFISISLQIKTSVHCCLRNLATIALSIVAVRVVLFVRSIVSLSIVDSNHLLI
ncbi:hypothetical protein R6Q59_002760 [Mikania micrantha]